MKMKYICNLEPRSPTARRKGDLVKFDFEHAYCSQCSVLYTCSLDIHCNCFVNGKFVNFLNIVVSVSLFNKSLEYRKT